MTIEQTVEIPANRRLTIDVPQDVPPGWTILTFTPAPQTGLRNSWRSLRGICKNSGDTLDAFLERKHAEKTLEDAAFERGLNRNFPET
jgi:hypothetical protein